MDMYHSAGQCSCQGVQLPAESLWVPNLRSPASKGPVSDSTVPSDKSVH